MIEMDSRKYRSYSNGFKQTVHILDVESSVRDIVNMTAIAVLDAIVEEIKTKSDAKIEL